MAERACCDCGEVTLNPERCRECDLEWFFTRSTCSQCKQMRFERDAVTGLGVLAVSLWGEPCACSPLPPSVYEASRA